MIPITTPAERARSENKPPLTPSEVEHLVFLGWEIRDLRQSRGLTQRELNQRAGFGLSTVGRLELGYRRVRTTTLLRLLVALDVADVDREFERLCAIGGPGVVDPPPWAKRREHRRNLRIRSLRKKTAVAVEVLAEMERESERRRVAAEGRERRRQRMEWIASQRQPASEFFTFKLNQEKKRRA